MLFSKRTDIAIGMLLLGDHAALSNARIPDRIAGQAPKTFKRKHDVNLKLLHKAAVKPAIITGTAEPVAAARAAAAPGTSTGPKAARAIAVQHGGICDFVLTTTGDWPSLLSEFVS